MKANRKADANLVVLLHSLCLKTHNYLTIESIFPVPANDIMRAPLCLQTISVEFLL